MTARGGLSWVYAGMGATAASVGPLLPVLADRLDTSPAVLSLATSWLFAGLLVGVVAAVAASRTVAAGPLLVAGAATQAAALAGLAVAPSTAAVYASAATLGVGFGVSEVTGSVLAGRGSDGPARLAHLTAVFAAAAILTPVVMAASVAVSGSVVAACLVVASLHVVGGTAVRNDRTRFDRPRARTTRTPAGRRDRRAVVATTLVLVSYVGAEATLATWSGELARSLMGVSTGAAALAPTGFWLCLLAGRVAATRLLRRTGRLRVLLGALGVGGAAALAGAIASPVAGIVALALVAVTGVAMGPVYGVSLSYGAQPSGGGSPMSRTGLLVGVGAVGGVAVPAVVAPLASSGPGAVVGAVGAFLLVAAAMATIIPRSASRAATSVGAGG